MTIIITAEDTNVQHSLHCQLQWNGVHHPEVSEHWGPPPCKALLHSEDAWDFLMQMGYSAEREPRIPTVKGTKIPDLCAWNGESYIVCDIAMVSNNMDLDRVHQFKTNKYNITDIHGWMRQNNPRQESGQMEANATAFIITWRGAISLETWSSWEKNRPSKIVFDVDFNKNSAGDPQNLEDLQNQCLERKEKAKENIHVTLILLTKSFLWLL